MGGVRKGRMPRAGLFSALCMAAWLMQAGGGLAQTAPATTADSPIPTAMVSSIVTLDRDRLFDGSMMGRAFQARFEAQTTALVAENRKLEAALEAEERSLTDRRRTLDSEAFRPLAEEFDARVEALRTAQDAKSRALSRAREADQQQFFEAVVPVLGQLMVDLEAVAIVDRSAIILSFDQIDITDQAIALLDASLGDGTLGGGTVVSPADEAPAAPVAPVPELPAAP